LLKNLNKQPRKKVKASTKLVLDLIQERLGMKKQQLYAKEYDDLDGLFGRWSETEFKTIENNMNKERRIDLELWE
jgi:hypothetical protein